MKPARMAARGPELDASGAKTKRWARSRNAVFQRRPQNSPSWSTGRRRHERHGVDARRPPAAREQMERAEVQDEDGAIMPIQPASSGRLSPAAAPTPKNSPTPAPVMAAPRSTRPPGPRRTAGVREERRGIHARQASR